MIAPRRVFPSIASLLALEALDRLGSASAVAEELSQTQSAVSRQLQALEHQLGQTLIARDGKRLGLTPEAKVYVTDIRQALTQIAEASLRLQVNPQAGTVNLAILPAFGMRWLMPRLPDFARRHPDVTINMSTQLEPFNFAAQSFDAALHFGTGQWPGTEKMLLRHEHMVAACAPELLRGRAVASATELLTWPLLHIQTRPQAWAEWFAAQGVAVPGPLPGTTHDQFSTITQAALHGLGVALLPDYLIEQDLAAGRLVRICGPAIEAQGAYYLVWPHQRTQRPALSLFRAWLQDQAEPEDPIPR